MEALVIRDFYHRYTVDEHTLVAITAVLNLRGMKGDPFAELAAETDGSRPAGHRAAVS